MPLRCCIVDDEPLAVQLLAGYVQKTGGLELQLATTDAFAALEHVRTQKPDILFLDIQMPELTGIQFIKIIQDSCMVIVTTAYSEFAVQGFELNVLDYLVKPIPYERFIMAIDKAKQRSSALQRNETPTHIFVKTDYRLVRINVADILFLESFRDYITIHTFQEKIKTLQSLRSFAETLPSPAFLRVHKSFIIAIDKITAIENNRILIRQTYIPIGDTFRTAVQKFLPIGKN